MRMNGYQIRKKNKCSDQESNLSLRGHNAMSLPLDHRSHVNSVHRNPGVVGKLVRNCFVGNEGKRSVWDVAETCCSLYTPSDRIGYNNE